MWILPDHIEMMNRTQGSLGGLMAVDLNEIFNLGIIKPCLFLDYPPSNPSVARERPNQVF